MEQVHFLLLCLLFCALGLSASNPKPVLTAINATSQTDAVHDVPSIDTSPSRMTPVPVVCENKRNKTKPLHLISPVSSQEGRHLSCSPKPYRVRVGNTNCSASVRTKMCHGACVSYTSPDKVNFSKAREAINGFRSTCTCCSAVSKSTRRFNIRCTSNGGGRNRVEKFYVPFAENCQCTRSCTQY
jgi:hypothetical protein